MTVPNSGVEVEVTTVLTVLELALIVSRKVTENA
jgi:hypothetical protein